MSGHAAGLRHIVCRLLLFLAIAGAAVPQASAQDISQALEEFKASKAINPSSTAVVIKNLASGKTLIDFNGAKPLIPASIMKSLTIASLMQHTDADDRFLTEVYLEGPVSNGVLKGNLLIAGSGDPTINSRYEPKSADFVREIADALKKRGIKEIEGEIAIDQSIFSGPAQPESWASGDRGTYYGTGTHGFNFEDNRTGKASVQSPAKVFLNRLTTLLSSSGISIGNREILPSGRKLLLRHQSAPIFEIMRSCMMRSDNMFAESFLRTYSLRKGGAGSTAEGARAETEYWKRRGMPMQNVNIVDGSGLSRSNRLTADFLASVLVKMADDIDYVSYFPLAGQEGTLRGFLKGTRLDSYIAMKTGSMSGVQCYAGYLLDDDFAPTYAVVIMANGFSSRDALRRAIATLLLGVFADKT